MPPFGQPEFTIAVKTMRGHVVWNPPRNLGQTPVLISFKSVTPHQPGLRTQDAGWDVALDQNRLALREPIPQVLFCWTQQQQQRMQSLLHLVLKDKGCCSWPFLQPTLCCHNHWSYLLGRNILSCTFTAAVTAHVPPSPSYQQAPSSLLTNSLHYDQNRSPQYHCHLIPSDMSAKREQVTNPLSCLNHRAKGIPSPATQCLWGARG